MKDETLIEIMRFARYCEDYFPDDYFNRTKYTNMLIQVAALTTAESMVNPEKYGADVTMEDVIRENKKIPDIIRHYMKIIKESEQE